MSFTASSVHKTTADFSSIRREDRFCSMDGCSVSSPRNSRRAARTQFMSARSFLEKISHCRESTSHRMKGSNRVPPRLVSNSFLSTIPSRPTWSARRITSLTVSSENTTGMVSSSSTGWAIFGSKSFDMGLFSGAVFALFFWISFIRFLRSGEAALPHSSRSSSSNMASTSKYSRRAARIALTSTVLLFANLGHSSGSVSQNTKPSYLLFPRCVCKIFELSFPRCKVAFARRIMSCTVSSLKAKGCKSRGSFLSSSCAGCGTGK
mmetsp:Transcript_68644/g.126534  ORF Transcript_68644/g.126534 Transcript_68644/m.126534 type:complete len:264 (+) Transcript_68644:44-835(+)